MKSTMTENENPTVEQDDGAQALVDDFKSLEAELARQKDLYLRLAADFDNFRKRTAREAECRAAAQKEAFIRELLPVIDNLERALATSSASPDQLREGVQMTLEQIKQLLKRHGIEPEESQGKTFDPNRHEAVAVAREESQPDQTILDTYQRGYRSGNEVFRPAKVVVNTRESERPSERRKSDAR